MSLEMAVNQNEIKESLVDCLSQQLSEYELLKSMYPNQGEIMLSDKNIVVEINNFLENKTEYIPSHLDFKINLMINSLKFELFINLPSSYPNEEPDIYVRCNQLNRQNESRLNSELSEYIRENHVGEVCLYTAISWLQENIDLFTIPIPVSNAVEDCEPESKEDEFARLWVHSHHIYNKRKREEIVKHAKELKLTGFSLPGRPGIICVEGNHSDCKEWWRTIKSMNWKKIVIRKTEIFESGEEKTYKKFLNFEELNSNMSDLAKYLNDLGLQDSFNDLFGLCNDD